MSRFQNPSGSETKRCAICQRRCTHALSFRGRYVCDECLSYVRERG
ncbi:MAG: hypothetical protein IJ486_01385 [Firmicutes bacterium]|nr:hypothetical protein [Bacillota bacterium]